MGCLKGESEAKPGDAQFACEKCGAAVKKKSHACKPIKLGESGKSAKSDKKEKKDRKK